MTIFLEKATSEDAEALHAIQIKSFLPLLKKYKDPETNPACELVDKTLQRINDPLKVFFKILENNILVGGVVVSHTAPGVIFIGPIFIDPDFQNQKIGQKAMKIIEDLYLSIDFFELSTPAQEKGNVHLYEKMGYVIYGESKKINNSLNIISLRKQRTSH